MILTNLKVLLAERNLSISKVSNDTGISRTTLTALSSNNCKGIQFDTLDMLCSYLNIMPDDFFLYSPYRITFRKNTDNFFIEIIIENRISHKKFNILGHLDLDKYGLSINLCIDDKANYQKAVNVIQSLPKFYLSKLTQDIKNILIKEYFIDETALKDFSLSSIY